MLVSAPRDISIRLLLQLQPLRFLKQNFAFFNISIITKIELRFGLAKTAIEVSKGKLLYRRPNLVFNT